MQGIKKVISEVSGLAAVYDGEEGKKEFVKILGLGCVWILVTAYIFFDNFLFAVPLIWILIPYIKMCGTRYKEKRLRNIYLEFKDSLGFVASSLEVGYSPVKAFESAAEELEHLYGKKSILAAEYRNLVKEAGMNIPVQDALDNMAGRMDVEEITYFSSVFSTAVKSGGNLIEIIKTTADNISEVIEVEEEIKVMLSAKKMEQKIMNIMPYAIILYLRVGSYEFIEPLYLSGGGRFVMIVCLCVYFAAVVISEKITDIKV